MKYNKDQRTEILKRGSFSISSRKKPVSLSDLLREVDHKYDSFKQNEDCQKLYDNLKGLAYPSNSVEQVFIEIWNDESLFESFSVPGLQKIGNEKNNGKQSRNAGLISERRLTLDITEVLKDLDVDGRLKIAKTGDPKDSKFLKNLIKSLRDERGYNEKQINKFIEEWILVEKNLAKLRPNATLIEKGVSSPDTIHPHIHDAFGDIIGDNELSYRFEPDNDIPLYDQDNDWLVSTVSVKRSASDINFEMPLINAYNNIKYQRENHNPNYIFWPYCVDATKQQLTNIKNSFKGLEIASRLRIPTGTPMTSCSLSDNKYYQKGLLMSHDEFISRYKNHVKEYLEKTHKSSKFFNFQK